jgi:adenylate kinase
MPRLIYSYLDVTNEDYGENSIMVEDYLWALIDEDLIIDESGKYSHHAGWLDREFNIRPNAYDKVLRGSIRIKEEPDKVIIMMLPYPWNDFQAKKYERNASSIEQGLKEFILEKTDKPVEIEKDLHQVYFWANQDFHDRVASKKEAKRMGRWIFVDGDVLLFGGKDSHAVDIYRHSKLKGEDFDKLLRGTLHKSDLDSDDFDYLIVFDIYTPEQDELYFKYADVVMKDMNENLNPSGERVIKEQANRYYKRTSSSLSLKLKIAKNSEDRARGYMFQEEKDVEPNTGILFVNSVPSTWGLWMANTYLPLSSAFLDKDGTILKIHKFMEPMTHKVYSSDVPAHYMVEIPMVKVAQENNYYIVIGPPASGKGTQAQLISNSFGIPHIGTGSLLREGRYPEQYEQEVQKSLTEGILLSDEIMTEILLSRLEEPDCENGFILDGFPRSVGQAESLDEFMQDKGREIKRVFNLKVSEEEILKRILGRGRADDTEEILKTRLEEYYKKTKPLENYYQDKITNIEAGVSPENTFEQIEKYATSHQTFKYAGEDYVSWFDLHNIKEGDKLIQVMPKTARTIYSQWSGEYLNKEYPETVYHVTTAKSKIMSEGPKTWKEVGDAIGFGHSKREKTGVSVTTHLDYAKKIYEDMLYSHDVLNGKISAKQVYEDGQEFALARNGERSKALDKMIKEEGGLDNIEGNLEKITKLLNFVIFIKGFAQNYVAQEFINTNIDTFKNIPRNEIAIIEMRLKRGARHNVVFDFPEDNEWRIYQSINLLPIQVVSSKISAIEDIDPFAENYIEQVVRDYIDYEIEKDRWEPRLRDYNWRNYCLRNDLGKKIYYKGLEVLNDIGFNYEKVPPMIGLAASPYMKILKQGWPTEEFVDDLNKWFDIRYLATLEPFKYIVKQYPQIGEIEYFLKKMRIRFSQKKTDWVAMTQGGLIHLNVPEMKELSDDRVVSILAHEITHFVQMMVKTPDRGSMHFIYKKFDAWLNDYFNLTHERGAFRTEVEGMLFRGLSEQDIIDELGIQIGLPLKNTKEYEEWKKDKPEDPEQYDRAWDLVEKFVHKLISDISRDFAKIAQLTPEQDEEMTYRQNGIWWVIDGKIDGAMTSDARHMNRARPEDYCTHPARMGLEMGMSHEEIDETLHGNFHYYEGHITNQIYFYLPRHYEEYDKIKPQIHQWIREKINAAQDAGTIWSALPKDIEIKDWISDCCPNRLRGNELYDTMNKHKKKWEKEDNPVSKETIEQMPFMEEPKSWSYASTKTANKYYHATFNQLFHKIMQEGLKDIAGDGGVFVADSPQKAINHFWSKYKWALNPSKYHGKSENREKRMLGLDPTKPMTIALLEVDLEPDSLESRGRYKMYPGEIPPENITFVTNLGQTVANKKRIIYAGPYMRLLKEGWPKDQYEAKKIGWTKFSDWFDIHYLMTLPQMQYLIDAYGGRDEIIRLLDRLQMKFTYAKKQRYVMRFSPSIVALTVNVAHVDYRNPTEVEQMLVHELTHYLQAASGFQFSNWRGMGEYMHTPQEQEAYMTMVYEMMNQGKSEQDIVDYFINLWGARFNLHRKVQIKAWVNHLMQWVYQDMEAREEKEQKEKAPPMLMPEFWQAAKDERRLIFAAAPLGLEDGYSRFWAIINGEIKTVEQDGSLYDTHANWLAEVFVLLEKNSMTF